MTPGGRPTTTLLERIETAMRDAMRGRDAARTSTLRMAMAAATNRRIELGRELTDDEMVDVLTRQVKQRRESIDLYRTGGREDRAAAEEQEIAVLAEFLPRQLTDAELDGLVGEAIAVTGASGPRDLGRVMGWLAPRTRGLADGRAVSERVRRRLEPGTG
jgi:uncharacterized protein YqeY